MQPLASPLRLPDNLGLIREWRQWASQVLTEGSVDDYAYWITKFFSSDFEGESVPDFDQLTLAHLSAWGARLNRHHPGKYEWRKAMLHLFRYAILAGYVAHNPATGIPARSPKVRVPEALAREQLAALADGAGDRREALAIWFLYATGARVSEAAEIVAPRDILGPVGARTLILRTTKRAAGEESRERPIPLESLGQHLGGEVLDELVEIGPLVRANIHRRDTLFGIERGWFGRVTHRAGERAGLPEHLCNPHRLRATFATHLLEAGVPLHVVRDLLGHRKIETTMRYAAVTDLGRRDAIGALYAPAA